MIRIKKARWQKIWVALFAIAIAGSMLFSSVAFAVNDPK
jgi:hypothetical protein